MDGIGAARAQLAGIVWGAALDKTLAFGFPMLDVVTYPAEREGSETVRARIQATDGWSVGSDRVMSFRLPAIPPIDAADPYGYGAAVGWDSVDGWADFLSYARHKNVIRFAPVLASYVAGTPATFVECRLVEPWGEAPEPGWNTARSLRIVLRAIPGQRFDGY